MGGRDARRTNYSMNEIHKHVDNIGIVVFVVTCIKETFALCTELQPVQWWGCVGRFLAGSSGFIISVSSTSWDCRSRNFVKYSASRSERTNERMKQNMSE